MVCEGCWQPYAAKHASMTRTKIPLTGPESAGTEDLDPHSKALDCCRALPCITLAPQRPLEWHRPTSRKRWGQAPLFLAPVPVPSGSNTLMRSHTEPLISSFPCTCQDTPDRSRGGGSPGQRNAGQETVDWLVYRRREEVRERGGLNGFRSTMVSVRLDPVEIISMGHPASSSTRLR